MCWSENNLFQRCFLAGVNTSTAGKSWVECSHSPVVTAPGRLMCTRKGRTDHHSISTTGDGLCDISTCSHSTISYDVDVNAGLI